MISIWKYLDSGRREPAAGPEPIPEPIQGPVPEPIPEADELSAVSLECYRAVLLAMGKSAARVCPGFGGDLDAGLRGLEQRLAFDQSSEALRRAEQVAEVQLQQWADRSSQHFKAQAQVVKELFIAMARTAESAGSRDQGFSSHYKELVGRLERIADLDDLTQIRSSLMKNVADLKVSIDHLTRNHRQLVDQLRTEVSAYESKLRSAEPLAFKDELTGMANRRILEDRIRLNIESGQEFCVVMLNLTQLQQVNQQHGRLAGDDLLKQFARELRLNTRSSDLVGRWGGGEFVIVLTGDAQAAKAYLERMPDWVFGKYTVQAGSKPFEIHVDASMGMAQWRAGKTVELLIAEADSARYLAESQSQARKL